METTYFLTVFEVIKINELVVSKFGGTHSVRDRGLIESALARCASGYYETIFDQAAALLQSLCLNHPFADGNKRASITACIVFLKLNQINLEIGVKDAEHFIINQVIINKNSIEDIACWLRKNQK